MGWKERTKVISCKNVPNMMNHQYQKIIIVAIDDKKYSLAVMSLDLPFYFTPPKIFDP